MSHSPITVASLMTDNVAAGQSPLSWITGRCATSCRFGEPEPFGVMVSSAIMRCNGRCGS